MRPHHAVDLLQWPKHSFRQFATESVERQSNDWTSAQSSPVPVILRLWHNQRQITPHIEHQEQQDAGEDLGGAVGHSSILDLRRFWSLEYLGRPGIIWATAIYWQSRLSRSTDGRSQTGVVCEQSVQYLSCAARVGVHKPTPFVNEFGETESCDRHLPSVEGTCDAWLHGVLNRMNFQASSWEVKGLSSTWLLVVSLPSLPKESVDKLLRFFNSDRLNSRLRRTCVLKNPSHYSTHGTKGSLASNRLTSSNERIETDWPY